MIKKSVAIFVLLSVAASALNYIIYPLLSRILPPGSYVDITVALSLFTQISTFLSSIIAITIGLSKSGQSGHQKIELLQSFLLKIFFVLASIFLLSSPLIMSWAKTPVLFALPIALMMLFSIPITVVSGYLNGRNKMTKLGLVTLISASCQFIIGLTIAFVSRNGLATMLSMTIAQVLTIFIVYTLFSEEHLPKISAPLKPSSTISRDKNTRKLITYTSLTSLAIMAISVIQIIDLFIVQSLLHADVKFYTDIYVVSRVVFFAGMIFIWPFLGEINISNHKLNRQPLLKLIGYFTVISVTAMGALYFWGDTLTRLLFGTEYSIALIRDIALLSIFFKFCLLIVTAVTLYFVVLRRYIAFWLSLITSLVVFLYSIMLDRQSDISSALSSLDLIVGALAIASIVLLFRTPCRDSATEDVA